MRSIFTRVLSVVCLTLFGITGVKAQVASGITFTSIGTNSFTVSWTNGSGAGRICVVRPAANSVALPVDGNAYAFSSVYGSGAHLGGNNYVVYRGTGSSVTVSGLSTYTQYAVTVFEYSNSPSAYNYNTVGYPTGYQYTLATQPATQVTNLNRSGTTPNSTNLSWTGGGGSYSLVTVRSGTTNNNLPADANWYTASTTYGSGDAVGSAPYSYSVYSNSGSSVSVTGLSPATNYVAAGFEFNGAYTGSQNYLTSGYDTCGFTTLATEPGSIATYLAATDIEDDAMTLSWLNPASGGGAYHLVLINDNSANDVPVDVSIYNANATYGLGSLIGSSYVVYAGSGNAVRVTGLNMETTYSVRVFEFNGGTGTFNNTTNYLTSYYATDDFTTNTTHPALASSNMTFTNINPTSVQVNWTNGGGQLRLLQGAAGRRPTGLAFDGVNDHVVVPYNAALQPTGALTLECWVNRTNWASSVTTQYYAGNAETGGYCFLHSGTYLYSYVYRNGTWGYNYTDVSHLTSGWHHLSMTYDGRYIRTYIDGALYNLNDAGGNYSIGYTYANAFIIGADVGTGPTTSGSYANCIMDEVRVWNTANSQYLIQYYMNRQLNGYETGLAGYWDMNEGYTSGSVANNGTVTSANLNGTLTNMTTTAAAAYTASSGWVYQDCPANRPVDFNSYNGSTFFPNGAYVGNTPHAIVNTTGSSATVTNLTPGSYYYFVVSDYDEDGYPYYNYHKAILTGEVQTAAGTVPAITNMSPTSGPVGTIVTLTGTGFSTTTTDNNVWFGATKATVTAATATTLTVVVPYGATFTPVSVQVNGLTGRYTREFIVTSSCSNGINSSSFSNSTITSGVSYETAISDYNYDGKVDLVSPASNSSFFYGLRGNSSNGVTPPTFSYNSYTCVTAPYHVEVADFDCDNKPDAAMTATGSSLFVVHTTAGGSFYIPAPYQEALAYVPNNIKSGDFDGDGKIDVAIGYSSGANYISVFRNTGSVGNPSFGARQDFNVGAVANCIYVRDLDLDGKSDIIFGQSAASQFGVLRSSGTPGTISFDAQDNFATAAAVNAITCADFNLDGKPDVAVACSNNTVRLFSNSSTPGNFTNASLTVGATLTTFAGTPVSVTCADLDGDGSPARPEVIVGYSGSNNVSIFEGTGNFGFAARVDIATSGTSSTHVAAGDFNQDGKMDIVASPLTTNLNILNNDMSPLASEPTTPASALTFSGQTQNAVTLNFTAGNGFNRLVLARQGLTVVNTPFDGTGYAANSIFGSGADVGGNTYVVYNGTGNSVTVTGLQSNTYYYFAVYEYNSNGSACTNNYLLTSTPAVTQTLNTPPTLNAIANPSAICQNSGAQVINLSGIGTGAGNETQTLTVTASSSNPALIPNPTVTYTSPNATGSLTYTPVNGQYGTSVVTVTVNDNASNNNITTRTFTVTVTQAPSTSVAGPDQQICVNSATLGATAPPVGTGTWSIAYTSNVSITTANLGNVNTPNTTLTGLNANDTVNLAWTVSNGTCTPSVDYVGIKRINCPLTAGFTWNPTTICATPSQINNISFTDASFAPSTTITSWSWSFSGPITPNPSVSSQQNPSNIQFTGPGTFTVTLTINDNAGGNSSITHFITVNPYPAAAGSITGPVPGIVCAGANSVPFSVSPIANASTYVWSLPPGATIVSGTGTNSILVNFASNASSGSVQVYGQNSCGTGAASAPFNITINPLPGATSSISGPTSVCQGQTGVVFSTTAIANATSYSWTLPVGATITSSPNGSSITVDFANNASGGTVNVIGVNSCGNGSSSVGYSLNMNLLPVAAGAITGNAQVCQGTTNVTYSVTPIANASTYNWTLPPGVVISSGAGTNSITCDFTNATGSGTVTVNGSNSCGNGTSASLPVTVGLLPSAATSISGNTTICAGSTGIQYSVSAIPNAGSYNWSLPPGVTITSNNGNVITVSAAPNAQSGTISVYGSNNCGNGIASAPLNITVNPLPDSTQTVSGPVTVCQGQTGVTFSVGSVANASTYNWTLPIGATVTSGSGTNSITVDFSTAAQSGDIFVVGNNSCGDGGATDTLNAVVNPLPDAAGAISGPLNIDICPQATGIVFSVPAIANASSYVWSLPQGATITAGANTNSITVDFAVTSSSGVISVYGSNSCGQGASTSISVSVATVTPADICLVTVDNNSVYNNIVWEKPVVNDIDSFRIYREITTNVYAHIGSVDYDSMSVYVDSVYTPLADPNVTSFRYKISSVDSCGNESPLSVHHRTLFLQANVGLGNTVNLNWNLYEGATVSFYRILRDSTLLNNWQIIDSVPGSNTAYTDLNPPTSVTVTDIRYKLETIWLTTCNPSRAINTSQSNLKDVPTLALQMNEASLTGMVNVYPNPSQGLVTVEYPYNAVGYKFEVRDALGRLVYTGSGIGKSAANAKYTQTLDLQHLAKGTYTLTLDSGSQRIHKKLVIQ